MQAVKRTNNAKRLVNGNIEHGGCVTLVATPEKGRSDTIDLFWDSNGQYHTGLINVTLYDCHDLYNDAQMSAFVGSVPPWARGFSILGIPSAGTGAVFAGIDVNTMLSTAYNPRPTDKRLMSIDFGYSKDANVVLTVFRDGVSGCFYVMNEKVDHEREAYSIALEVRSMQKSNGAVLVWPRDGAQNRGFGKTIIEVYKENGVHTTSIPFNNADIDPDNGIGIEIGVIYLRELMLKGMLKIHPSCSNLIKELGLYSYDNKGKFIDRDNHSIDALRYAICGFNVFAKTHIEDKEADFKKFAEQHRRNYSPEI